MSAAQPTPVASAVPGPPWRRRCVCLPDSRDIASQEPASYGAHPPFGFLPASLGAFRPKASWLTVTGRANRAAFIVRASDGDSRSPGGETAAP